MAGFLGLKEVSAYQSPLNIRAITAGGFCNTIVLISPITFFPEHNRKTSISAELYIQSVTQETQDCILFLQMGVPLFNKELVALDMP